MKTVKRPQQSLFFVFRPTSSNVSLGMNTRHVLRCEVCQGRQWRMKSSRAATAGQSQDGLWPPHQTEHRQDSVSWLSKSAFQRYVYGIYRVSCVRLSSGVFVATNATVEIWNSRYRVSLGPGGPPYFFTLINGPRSEILREPLLYGVVILAIKEEEEETTITFILKHFSSAKFNSIDNQCQPTRLSEKIGNSGSTGVATRVLIHLLH